MGCAKKGDPHRGPRPVELRSISEPDESTNSISEKALLPSAASVDRVIAARNPSPPPGLRRPEARGRCWLPQARLKAGAPVRVLSALPVDVSDGHPLILIVLQSTPARPREPWRGSF